MKGTKKLIQVKKGRVKENYLVTQSNKFIEAMYRMGLTAKKLMVCMISQIEPQDEDFKFYMIPVSDFKALAKITGRTDYFEVLTKVAKEFRNQDITIKDGSQKINVSLVTAVKEDKASKMVGIRFDKELKPYLLDIKAEFTRYQIKNVMELNSVYSIRLYELLKQYEHTDRREREEQLDDLRNKLGVEPNKYQRYHDFKRKVLEVAAKEIPEKTDIGFTYKERKAGRRVNWIIFTIKPRKKMFVDDGKGEEIDTADVYSPRDCPEEVLKWIPEKYRTHHDVLRDTVKYCETHGQSYVVQKVAYTVKMKPERFPAYLGNALKKNLGADFDPHQMKLFEESKAPLSMPGMTVIYNDEEYTIDENGCLWPESGGCMPPGRVNELIENGQIKISTVD